MDNASGVASVLEIARTLSEAEGQAEALDPVRAGHRPRKRVCWARSTSPSGPASPAGSVVADLNMDMALPLWPLKSVIVLGVDESTLGDAARAAARNAAT